MATAREAKVYCPRCGSVNAAGRQNCDTCSADLGPRDGSAACSACGALVSSSDRYCWSCGSAIDEGKSATDLDARAFGSLEAASPPPWMTGEAAELGLEQPGEPEMMTTGGDSPPPGALDLPEWLRDESDSSVDLGPPELDLIDDDDLPAWIPELAKTENGDYDRPQTTQAKSHITSGRQPPVVPPVSRAWLTQSPRHSPSDGIRDSGSVNQEAPASVVSTPSVESVDPVVQPPASAEGDSLGEETIVSADEVVAEASPTIAGTMPPAPESPEPEVGEESPEIAEAAGLVVTAHPEQAAQAEVSLVAEEVAVATGGAGTQAMQPGDRGSKRRVIFLIVGLLILAAIVAAVVVYLVYVG